MVAGIFGFALLLGGLFSPHPKPPVGSLNSGGIYALILFFLILGYNAGLKRISIIGPITMGLCRFFNIGIVSYPLINANSNMIGFYALSVFVYITAVTILSSYEAKSLFVRKLVGIGLSSIILIDAVWCLVFVGVFPVLIFLALYPVAMGLRKIVSMT